MSEPIVFEGQCNKFSTSHSADSTELPNDLGITEQDMIRIAEDVLLKAIERELETTGTLGFFERVRPWYEAKKVEQLKESQA